MIAFASQLHDEPPLCVDLDGTLVKADCLKLALRHLLLRRPWTLPALLLHLPRGRARFKLRVAQLHRPDPATLPYRESVLQFLHDQRERGRRLILATAAEVGIGRGVADHLGLFDDVIACEGTDNPKGVGKVIAIHRRTGSAMFDYIGDSMADLPVFERARHAYLAGPSAAVRRATAGLRNIVQVFE